MNPVGLRIIEQPHCRIKSAETGARLIPLRLRLNERPQLPHQISGNADMPNPIRVKVNMLPHRISGNVGAPNPIRVKVNIFEPSRVKDNAFDAFVRTWDCLQGIRT